MWFTDFGDSLGGIVKGYGLSLNRHETTACGLRILGDYLGRIVTVMVSP
ncbi:MAG: hypothetical protein NC340_04160 [Ruminococcus flavefaciens]|nr:hypothetical protein [Ruminococcus flavefaciens]MCM1229246.1 hypothetical protein [Ruminococcus flavefaciens]